jgi:hypothetical protein
VSEGIVISFHHYFLLMVDYICGSHTLTFQCSNEQEKCQVPFQFDPKKYEDIFIKKFHFFFQFNLSTLSLLVLNFIICFDLISMKLTQTYDLGRGFYRLAVLTQIIFFVFFIINIFFS